MKTKFLIAIVWAGMLSTTHHLNAQNITGASTQNYVLKFTNTSGSTPTAGNSLIFDNSTQVGIGMGASLTSGIGFQTNVGIVRISAPANPTANFFQISPNYAGSGDIPAGTFLSSGAGAGGGLSLLPTGGSTAGIKLGAYVYNGSAWKSVWEAQNGSTVLSLVKSGGSVGIGMSGTPGATLHLAGTMKIDGTNSLEFGAGSPGKEVNAGKIGYQTFTSDALDIVGAGTTSVNRKIKFWNEGGASFAGNVGIGTSNPNSLTTLHVSSTGNTILGVQAGAQSIWGMQTFSGANAMHIGSLNGSNLNPFIYINSGGNIGIGHNAPASMFHVKSTGTNLMRLETTVNTINPVLELMDNSPLQQRMGAINFLNSAAQATGQIGYSTATNLMNFNTNNQTRMIINSSGNVGIGDTYIPSGYMLAVKGKIIAEEVDVRLRANWPDYVFKKDYCLPTLKEVDSFIQENGHLPGVPSAKQVEENGLQLGEMQTTMMKKIEELTLYVIEQQKTIDGLKKEVVVLKSSK